MKSVIKRALIATAGLLIINTCIGQTNPGKDTFSVVGGKWIVCVDTSLVRNYECNNPYSGFEFLKDGSYREYPRTILDPKKPILHGKWMLNKNEFTIDQDDLPGIMELPKTYLVIWVDKNHFYSSNKDGQAGPSMFVYFQRVP